MPSSTTTARFLTIAFLAGCSAFGAYATLGTASRNGLLAALRKASGPDVKPKSRYFPGGPAPYKTTYTGIAAIDEALVVLIAFFTVILSEASPLDVTWVTRYLMTQLLAGWLLIYVEGLRRGNKGRIVSWTGTFGLIFQNITYTVTVPVYLIIHLLTSPVSGPDPSADDVSVDAQDLFVLPFSVVGAFVVPTVMMALPSPARVAPAAHYDWLALWQVFPAAQSVYHGAARRATAPIHFRQDGAPRQTDDLYRLVAALAFVPHATLLALAAAPARLVPDAALALAPGGLTRHALAHMQFDLARAFVPALPWRAAPAGGLLGARAVEVRALAGLVKTFLQWDVYVGGLAVLAWAVFVHAAARPGRGRGLLTSVAPRVVVWTALGGPIGAATMLLWERDAVVRQRSVGRRALGTADKH